MTIRLNSIHVHPIKSLGGFSVQQAKLTPRGVQHDRRWMLVDTNGRFISQREHAQLACLHCTEMGNGFRVTDIRNGDHIDLPWTLNSGMPVPVKIWDDLVDVLEASHVINAWFSSRSRPDARLVYMPDSSVRPTDVTYAKGETSLSDGFPFLIISEASLVELNGRMGQGPNRIGAGDSGSKPGVTTGTGVTAEPGITMERFRPNLVISGGEAFQEDAWKKIRIGASQFELVKPCARCVITTTDQRTGERGVEPLRTLATYRKRVTENGSVKLDFGMNAMCIAGNVIRVGDLVSQ